MVKRRPQPTDVKKLPTSDIRAELDRRRRLVGSLTRRRAWLAGQLAEVDRRLASAGVALGRRRPRNERSLVETILAVMKGKRMSIPEIIAAVRASGYQSSSANFRVMVNERLITSGRFKRVGRGMYEAK